MKNKDILKIILKNHYGIKYNEHIHNYMLNPNYKNTVIKELINNYKKYIDKKNINLK